VRQAFCCDGDIAYKPVSAASTRWLDKPNTRLAQFDLALPGSQPRFQRAAILPALRAAIALGCTIQPVSRFDRKHYFYHDQPAGYQITQYYHPFATDGRVVLDAHDGLEEGQEVVVGIKQIQMEQDTARTQEQDGETSLIDFNRAGQPLIEIISLPHLHSPRAAAAYVKKIQTVLSSVDAVTTGMELGGLRADVNVSVRRKDAPAGAFSFSGVTGLGQRTEIKNLSTFKGVEDAIKAERDRQISVLEAGGVVEGETRGWSLAHPHETRRLRGKEGEVDYRYMPDPDIPPLYISDEVVEFLTSTLPPTPEKLLRVLVLDYGLSDADAKSMLALDDGLRLIYFQDVVDQVRRLEMKTHSAEDVKKIGKTVGNWVLHELGSLLSTDDRPWSAETVPARSLAEIMHLQGENKITGTSAKHVLKLVYDDPRQNVDEIVQKEGLLFVAMSEAEYKGLATKVIGDHPQHVQDIREKKKLGKIKFLVGQMMREGDRGRMQAVHAESVLRRLLIGAP